MPGKPTVLDKPDVDSICLVWEPPKKCFEDHNYQVRFKETKGGAKWSFYQQLISACTLQLSNLKSNTEYVFQVRMVCDESEGQYSLVSDAVKTVESAAHHLLSFMYDVEVPDIKIPLKKIPLEEMRQSRNTQGKTRKLVLGLYNF